jgi:hypothetical protein
VAGQGRAGDFLVLRDDWFFILRRRLLRSFSSYRLLLDRLDEFEGVRLSPAVFSRLLLPRGKQFVARDALLALSRP